MMPDRTCSDNSRTRSGSRPDFFFRPFTLHLKEIKFRKRARLGVKEQRPSAEQAIEYFERYHEIEELLGESRRFEASWTSSQSRPRGCRRGGGRVASQVETRTRSLPNLVELLETKGIKVYEVELEEEDCDGFSAETEMGPVIVLAPNKICCANG